jgi:lipopolysaccharide/colanic/teichoic acid biosynthesis glycosyltransferase
MYRSVVKPLLDGVVSLALLLMLSWLFLLVVLVYFVTFQWPVTYASVRMGKAGTPFTMYKFRTLKSNAALPLHARQFPLGKFLRATNLDELPQLMHVLKGEMSLVGPRALPVEYEPLLTETQRQRHHVLPGITGLAQVNGKNSLPWEEKFALDLRYVRECSFGLDCKILLKTIVLVVQMKRDVSLEEEALRKN